jgi:hypothetical protein
LGVSFLHFSVLILTSTPPEQIASYIGIVLFIAPYLFWKIFKKSKVRFLPFLLCFSPILTILLQFVRAKDMDLFSGRLDTATLPIEPIPTTAWGRFVDWLFCTSFCPSLTRFCLPPFVL